MPSEENRTLSDKYLLRLPDGMRDRIKEAAARNGRSMNSEILATLEQAYPPPTISIHQALEHIAQFEHFPESPELIALAARAKRMLDAGHNKADVDQVNRMMRELLAILNTRMRGRLERLLNEPSKP